MTGAGQGEINQAEVPASVRVDAVSVVLHVTAYNAAGDPIHRQPVDAGEVGRARFPRLVEIIAEHEKKIAAQTMAEVAKMLAAAEQKMSAPTQAQE